MQVILLAAISLDGLISQSDDLPSTKWTSSEDTAYFKRRTKELQICVMGRTTFQTIGRGLPGRAIVVLSRSGDGLQDFPELSTANMSEITPEGKVWWTKLPIEQLVASLSAAGKANLVVCGGSSVYSQFFESGLVDKVELTVEEAVLKSGKKLLVRPLEKHELMLREIVSLSEKTQVFEYDVKAKD